MNPLVNIYSNLDNSSNPRRHAKDSRADAAEGRTKAWSRAPINVSSLLCGLFAALALSVSSQLFAQAGKTASIDVYSPKSKLLITQLPLNTPYELEAQDGQWQLVRFLQAKVPVWASASYVSRVNGQGTVLANRLNLRLAPSINAPVLTSVARGYNSPVLAQEGEFVKLLAPNWVIFAIPKDIENTVIEKSTIARPSVARVSVTEPEQAVETAVETPVSSEAFSSDQPRLQTADASAALENEPVKSRWRSGTTQAIEQSPAPESTPESNAGTLSEVNQEPQPKSSSVPAEYRLSPGDTISLRVFGEEDLSASALRIPQSGQLSFPLIGTYAVTGKTVPELEEQIRSVLAQGYVRNPRLSISIDSYRPVFVLGAAESIGSFQYAEGLTIAKAIAVAGGAKFSARPNGVSLLRDGEIVEDGLSVSSQMYVQPGDIISIEEEEGVGEAAASYVYLHGEVRSPGEYTFRRGLTVEKAVVLAGGFTLRASRRKISVSRIVEGEDAPVKMKKVALHMPVQPGDIIDVGASWF